MISTLTRTPHLEIAPFRARALASALAALWIVLALSLTASAAADVPVEAGGRVTAAYTSPGEPDSPAGSPAASVDPDDEVGLLTTLATAALAALVSSLAVPVLTGLSFRHPPLLQPPQ
jgi:hypothetical protein